jgi:hypothetical protein
MAVVSGTVQDVWNYTAPFGPVNDSSGNQVLTAYVSATFTGTYDQSADAQILLLNSTIASKMHAGKTVTLIDACFAAPGDEAGTPIGAKTTAISSTTLTCELTGGDLSTEHSAAALGSFNRPIAFAVTYKIGQP